MVWNPSSQSSGRCTPRRLQDHGAPRISGVPGVASRDPADHWRWTLGRREQYGELKWPSLTYRNDLQDLLAGPHPTFKLDSQLRLLRRLGKQGDCPLMSP